MAGGRGSRIGAAKALLDFRGKPLISYPLAAFAEARIEAVVVAKRDSSLPPLDVPVWHEPDEPRHPLCGIVAALEQSEGRPLIVCACDMPFVTGELLSHFSERDEPIVVPRAGGRMHPLVGRYDPSLLDALRRSMQPPRALHEVIAGLGPAIVDETQLRRFGDPERLLFNVNTRDDLERAKKLVS
jgi:molybdopterin-guanine dinucleotide biosynthesis protein A